MDSRRQPTLTAFFPRSSAKKGSAALAPAQSAAAANGVASAAGPRSGQAKTTVAKLDAATRETIARYLPTDREALATNLGCIVVGFFGRPAKGSTSRSGAVSGATSKKAGVDAGFHGLDDSSLDLMQQGLCISYCRRSWEWDWGNWDCILALRG
ncbi:hypothetical protein DFJ73DRAFT_767227 [Zopfochytrium polystomum]|nr:hypothetical protein DFJ73DRAFT_767227 [Zopfochytrium polystomum]